MADTPAQNLPVLTTPATSDGIIIVDDYGATPVVKIITLSNLLKILNALTVDSTPDGSADYLMTYDTSAAAPKKILSYQSGVVCLAAQYFGYLSPANATTYYFGAGVTGMPSTTANDYRFTIRRPGTIYAIDLIYVVDGTLSSGQLFSTWLRINNTTDYLISSSCVMSSKVNRFSTSASISVNAGDTLEIKFTTPSWTTLPTNTRGVAYVWIK